MADQDRIGESAFLFWLCLHVKTLNIVEQLWVVPEGQVSLREFEEEGERGGVVYSALLKEDDLHTLLPC